MSEFDTIKNAIEREGGKVVVDIEKELNEDTEEFEEVKFLCIPAMKDEFLILGFDTDGELCYIDAGADWEDYLKRKEAHEAV